MSDELEKKIDRLAHALEKHDNWLWVIWHHLIGAIASTIGVIFVLSVGLYILRKLNVLPGFNLFLDQFLPTLERYRSLRGF